MRLSPLHEQGTRGVMEAPSMPPPPPTFRQHSQGCACRGGSIVSSVIDCDGRPTRTPTTAPSPHPTPSRPPPPPQSAGLHTTRPRAKGV